ncbi:MAG: hypothetical protein F6K65_23225, partial [Moorea sp. SIO3C2]|nr:hypothetical protein [Moorena sp. SIO3C2]
KTADEFGFVDPAKKGRQQAKLMAFWLVPFGAIGGYAFNLSTQYMLVPEIGAMGNHILGAYIAEDAAGGCASFSEPF